MSKYYQKAMTWGAPRRTFFGAATLLALAISATSASADVVTYNASLAAPNAGIPGVYFGTGNANTNFTVNTLTDGIELGLSAIQRYVGPIVPSTNVYQVPTGATTVPTKSGAAWGVDFSIDVGPGGDGSGLTLGDISASWTLTDVARGTTGGFNPLLIPDNTAVGTTGVTTPQTNADWAAQNSEALSFASIASAFNDPGFDLNANDTYDFTLSVSCTDAACGGPNVALGSVSIVVVAGTGAPVPEPASWAVLGVGLFGLGVSRFKWLLAPHRLSASH